MNYNNLFFSKGTQPIQIYYYDSPNLLIYIERPSAPHIARVASLVLHLFHIISCLLFVHIPTFGDNFL